MSSCVCTISRVSSRMGVYRGEVGRVALVGRHRERSIPFRFPFLSSQDF
jgi:hypothetical protein